MRSNVLKKISRSRATCTVWWRGERQALFSSMSRKCCTNFLKHSSGLNSFSVVAILRPTSISLCDSRVYRASRKASFTNLFWDQLFILAGRAWLVGTVFIRYTGCTSALQNGLHIVDTEKNTLWASEGRRQPKGKFTCETLTDNV